MQGRNKKPSRHRNKPKKQFLVSRNEPKQTRNRSCFGLFRFEPKFFFSFRGHPTVDKSVRTPVSTPSAAAEGRRPASPLIALVYPSCDTRGQGGVVVTVAVLSTTAEAASAAIGATASAAPCTDAAGEAFSPQKRTSITKQEISYFFLQFLWVIFSLLDPDPDYESGSGSETLGRITNVLLVQDPVTGRPVQSLEFLLLVKSCHSMKDFIHMTKKLLDDLSQVPVFSVSVVPNI